MTLEAKPKCQVQKHSPCLLLRSLLLDARVFPSKYRLEGQKLFCGFAVLPLQLEGSCSPRCRKFFPVCSKWLFAVVCIGQGTILHAFHFHAVEGRDQISCFMSYSVKQPERHLASHKTSTSESHLSKESLIFSRMPQFVEMNELN